MPVMTKMRESMPVVFAVLAGIFLLMIIFQWGGQGTLFSPKGETGTLGTVNGYPITQQEYNRFLEGATAEMKSKSKDKEETLNESEEADAQDNAWDKAVSNAIMLQSIEKMGVVVTNDEVRDMLFNSPSEDIRKAFTDSTGNFHQDEYIKQLRNPKFDSAVRIMEGNARQQIQDMKWKQAMATTVRVTDTEAYIRYMTDSAKAILQVIKILPQTVSPNAPVPAKEIQAYYDSHSWMYQQEEQRKFKFVRFPLVPNARDTALVMETANTLRGRLAEVPASGTDSSSIDSVVKELSQDYSDVPFAPRHVVTMRELGTDSALINAKEGDNVVAKITGKITAVHVLRVFDSIGHAMFHLRHIQVGYPANTGPNPTPAMQDSARAVANQIIQQLKSGADFAELARTRSADFRTAGKGGDMGWLDTGMLPPTYHESMAAAHSGDVIGPLEGPRGFDIIQVLQHTQKSWLVVGVSLVVKPSHQTLDLESQMANLFRDQAEKSGFDQAATSAGYHVITDAPCDTERLTHL